MWCFGLYFLLVVGILFTLTSRYKAVINAEFYENLLKDSRLNEKSLVEENRDLREALRTKELVIKEKDEVAFKYAQKAATLRSRVRKLAEDLEEAIK